MSLRDAVKPLNQVLKARGLGFDSLHNLSQPEHWRRGGTGDLLLVGHIVHPPEQALHSVKVKVDCSIHSIQALVKRQFLRYRVAADRLQSSHVILLMCAALAGCASAPKVPERVLVPVPVACIKEAPDVPTTMDDAVILQMDDYAATMQVWIERLLLRSYALKAEALIAACK